MAHRFLGKYDDRKGAWLKQGKQYVLLLVVLFLIMRLLLGVSWVNGESMHPTLKNGAAVIYFRPTKNYRVGDIVSVKMAYGEYYIKRVVAVGGDTVDIQNGELLINGVPENDDWAFGETECQDGIMEYPFTVPEGKYFVVGDNRPGSIDSRTFGAIAASQTRGKILFHIG